MSVYEKLKQLGITLPAASVPAASYLMSRQSGNMVYVSGHIAKQNSKPWIGKLGETMQTDAGYIAARSVALDLLATLQAHTGDLTRVTQMVKLLSLVNCTPSYTETHLVTNGASELLVEVFGERGKHARAAFGVAQLPLGACLEIELIAEVQ